MRRSATITLTLLSGVASAVLAACRDEPRRCVDAGDRVVPDSLCANAEAARAASTRDTSVRRGGGGGMLLPALFAYRYYYGGSGYRGVGSVLSGGSYAPSRSARRSGGPSGSSAGRAGAAGAGSTGRSNVGTGTARGGFGGTGSGRGGFSGS